MPTTPGCASVPCSGVANTNGVDKVVLGDNGSGSPASATGPSS